MAGTEADAAAGRGHMSDACRARIESWLTDRIAAHLNTGTHEVDRDQSFSAYGIDSITAAGLSGDLEDWLGRPVAATVLLDHPTIAQVAAHLCEPPSSSPADPA